MFILFFLSNGYERTILISTSKIKNKIATKKNWNENGMWEGDMELNPHSNWLDFSWYEFSTFCVVFIAVNMTMVSMIAVRTTVDIFIFLFFLLIGN